MATTDEPSKDKKTQTGAERQREAELYVKNPDKRADFTAKREQAEKEAKEKADKSKPAPAAPTVTTHS
jgi:hypothetical protein